MRFVPEVMDTASSYFRYLGQFAIVRLLTRADSPTYLSKMQFPQRKSHPTPIR
jgi:hypothetical protein